MPARLHCGQQLLRRYPSLETHKHTKSNFQYGCHIPVALLCSPANSGSAPCGLTLVSARPTSVAQVGLGSNHLTQAKEQNREPNHLARRCRRHHPVRPRLLRPTLIATLLRRVPTGTPVITWSTHCAASPTILRLVHRTRIATTRYGDVWLYEALVFGGERASVK